MRRVVVLCSKCERRLGAAEARSIVAGAVVCSDCTYRDEMRAQRVRVVPSPRR